MYCFCEAIEAVLAEWWPIIAKVGPLLRKRWVNGAHPKQRYIDPMLV